MRLRLALPMLALLLTGCAGSDGSAQLNVYKAAGDDHYVATFERALFSENGNGQTDLILLSGNADPALEGAMAGGPAVRQTVHIRVLWQPTRTIRLDSPSAGNAMVDWRISASDADQLTYAGSCWAKISVDGDEAEVDLREANVSIRQVKGSLHDPLQRAKLDGAFVARRADATVRAYVDELAAAARTGATALSSPPARAVVP